MLSFVVKTINNEGPIYLNDMFALNHNSHTRKRLPLIQPKFKPRNMVSAVYVTKEVVCGIISILDNEYGNNDKLKEWESSVPVPLMICVF